MMIIKKCLVIDDSEEVIFTLTTILSQFPFLEIFSAKSFEEALKILLKNKVDLVILDVDLDGKDGFNLISFLNETPPTLIISSSPEYAAKSYAIDKVMGFFKKPIDFDSLTSAVGNILSLKVVNTGFIGNDYCFLKVGTKMTKFNFDYIDFIQGYGMYSKIHYDGKIIVVTESLSSLEKNLPAKIFKRIHKSYIININKISRINHKHCIIKSIAIPIGNSYKPQVEPLIDLFKI